jgi:hypothetical protein
LTKKVSALSSQQTNAAYQMKLMQKNLEQVDAAISAASIRNSFGLSAAQDCREEKWCNGGESLDLSCRA